MDAASAAAPAMGRVGGGGGGGGGSMRGGGRFVGDYLLIRQIGSGSYSSVWHARHRVRGAEVAVKEIIMDRLSKKLHDSLLSEIFILKRISHPNIIGLHDIIEGSGRIYLVLEYCRGGDLFMYIQRHRRIPEVTAKHFMRQLASGLQVLRENNIIHRDLKPQNLLLLTNDENSVLKIADFGFARSLQPRGLAETLCGSPLYMAPEIMQLQKYDAKADLWSVGAILFQLVTGRTPFTGNNQMQLFQNIVKSNDLRFPPECDLSPDCINLCQKLLRRNPVERLTFEEFFNHRFLLSSSTDGSLSGTASNTRGSSHSVECSPTRKNSQDDCLPFLLDDISAGQDRAKKTIGKVSVDKVTTFGFSLDQEDKVIGCGPSKGTDIHCLGGSIRKSESVHPMEYSCRPVEVIDRKPDQASLRIVDSLEFVDQDYVFVHRSALDLSSSSACLSWRRNSSCTPRNSPPKKGSVSTPMPIVGAVAACSTHPITSLESCGSLRSGASPRSLDVVDNTEQPSKNCVTRIRSLHRCASVVSELVNEKMDSDGRLEAFSLQLVVLAIWKQAIHICHAQAASAKEESPTLEATSMVGHGKASLIVQESIDAEMPGNGCQLIEREFLREVGRAEDLFRDIGQLDETMGMPDAMEIIFQAALTSGRHGAVDEMMGNTVSSSRMYSRAVDLLHFLLVEAPSIVLNPPFVLTTSDRHRLRSYIHVLKNRQGQSGSRVGAASGPSKCDDPGSV